MCIGIYNFEKTLQYNFIFSIEYIVMHKGLLQTDEYGTNALDIFLLENLILN